MKLRLPKSLICALVLLAAQLSALGAEVAVLRNGFSIRHLRREQLGDTTRLYTAEGYVDVATEQIASFAVDDLPILPPAETQQPKQMQVANQIPVEKPRVDLNQVVREASAKRRLDPDFVNSVIKAESNFKAHAVSPKGAQGLMQLMPGTAAQLGVNDPFDPKANVEGGTAYLNSLLDYYHDDPIKALAAYNAGTQRVEQYHGVPPYRETRSYIARIVRDFNAKKKAQKTSVARVSTKTAIARKTTRKKKVQRASVAAAPATGRTN